MSDNPASDPRYMIEQQWLAGIQLRCVSTDLGDCWLHIYFYEAPEKPTPFSSESKLLQEARRQNIGKGYSISFDRNTYSFADTAKDHLHFLLNGQKIGAVNRDGTAHDKSHGVRIPNHMADYIRSKYPDFQIRPDNMIEGVSDQDEIIPLYLIEENLRST